MMTTMKFFNEEPSWYPVSRERCIQHTGLVFDVVMDSKDVYILTQGEVSDSYKQYNAADLKALFQEAIQWIERMEREGATDE